MKRYLTVVVALGALIASADYREVATVQVADVATLTKAANQLGALISQPMLGALLDSSLKQNDYVKAFGLTRKGATVVFPVFIEEKGSADAEVDLEAAIIYPFSKKRDEIMRVAKKTAQNGIFKFKLGKDEKVYFAFEDDYLVVSDKLELIAPARATVKSAKKSLNGALLRVMVGPAGIRRLSECVEKQFAGKKDVDSDQIKKVLAYFRSVACGAVSVRFGECGIEVTSAINLIPSSEVFTELAARKPLPANPFAFARDNDFFVGSGDDRSGEAIVNVFEEIKRILLKRKISLSSITIKYDNALRFTVDVAKLFAEFEQAQKTLVNIDQRALRKDLVKAIDFKALVAHKDETLNWAFALTGVAPKAKLASEFARVMPEAAKYPLLQAHFGSYYLLFKACLSAFMATLDKSEQVMLKPIVDGLPEYAGGGIAQISWLDGQTLKNFCRVSPEEVKSIGAASNAISSYIMMKAMATSIAEGDEDDDDDDIFDDDEDIEEDDE